MKRILTLLLASLLLALTASSADDTKPVSSIIDLKGASPSMIWPIYEKLSGRKLVIDSRAKAMDAQITLRIENVQTTEEVLKQMREAFLKQARIVITRLDDKRESVTFNDALPIPR
jgi:hypothetical protein